ncbi:MAG: ornithine carbamoyltransferase [Campylobacterales bacterium]
MRHFLTIRDFSKTELLEMLRLSHAIKAETKRGEQVSYLEGQTLGMIFEKSSTRTRVSFEVGMYQLGGYALFLSNRDLQLGRGEPIKDSARVISRMVDMVMIRTFEQARIEEFAAYSRVPVINGLTDQYHPVQVMTDYMTMQEYGKGDHPVVAWVGDGNNMAHSWLMLASKLGFELRLATPAGYDPDPKILAQAQEFAADSGAKILLTHDPKEAVKGADVVTTDVWTSMGQEEESAKRLKDFAGFTIDEALMRLADPEAIFLHCLPAHRGEEVSEEVFEGRQSVVFDEAENRLHFQKGLMVWLDRERHR